jgi:hypothetical protein
LLCPALQQPSTTCLSVNTGIYKEAYYLYWRNHNAIITVRQTTHNQRPLSHPDINPLVGLNTLQIVAISDTHGFEVQLLH